MSWGTYTWQTVPPTVLGSASMEANTFTFVPLYPGI